MDTMKTPAKPNTPPQKPPNDLVDDLATMAGIPVYELSFSVGMNNKPDLPIPDFGGGQGKLRARKGREITYLPKMLFYRVIQVTHEPKGAAITFYIPREWATFTPIDGQTIA